MIVQLSDEAASLLFHMVVSPRMWWKREDWHEIKSPTMQGKVARLHRWIEKHIRGEEQNGQAPLTGGKFSLTNELVVLAQEHAAHYKDKKPLERKTISGDPIQCPFTTLHWVDLAAGLEGKPLATADDGEDPEDMAILAQAEHKAEGK